MNAIEILREDHDIVRDLFEQIIQCDDDSERRELFNIIHEELSLHSQIEEMIFYPAFNEFDEFKELLNESYANHYEIKELLEEIENIEDEEIIDQIDELIECVEHHVEEEENVFFPKAQILLDEIKLNQLGHMIEQLKQEKMVA